MGNEEQIHKSTVCRVSRIEQFRDKERNDEALTVTERREYGGLLAKHSYLRKA